MRSLASLLVVALAAGTAAAQPREGEAPEVPSAPSAEPPASASAPIPTIPAPAPTPTDSAAPPVPAEPTASSPAPLLPPADPCAGVTCSGQGACVVVGAAPACTCKPGYQASLTVALECVPIVPPVLAPLPLPERVQVETAEGRELGSEYAEYLAAGGGGGFARFIMERYGTTRNLGLGLLIPGLVLMYGGGVMLAAGVSMAGDHSQEQVDAGAIPSQSDYQYTGGETALVAVGGAAALVGLAGLIGGSVIFGEGRRGQERLAPLAEQARAADAPVGEVELRAVGPMWSATGAPAGMSVELGF